MRFMRLDKSLLCSILLLMIGAEIHAQTCLSYDLNALRPDDIIPQEEINGLPTTKTYGDDVVCDFTNTSPLSVQDEIVYMVKDDTTMIGIEHGIMRTYKQIENALYLIKYETPRMQCEFDEPLLIHSYPSYPGTQIVNSFHAKGKYCDKTVFTQDGTCESSLSRCPYIIVQAGDTLYNALQETIIFHTRSVANDASEQEEEYAIEHNDTTVLTRWYLQGYRYPIYEITQATSVLEGDASVIASHVYRSLPAEQTYPDFANEQLRQLYDEASNASKDSGQPPLSYTISNSSGSLTISYDVSQETDVTFTLCDSKGVVYQNVTEHHVKGDGYSTIMDTSSLRHGDYVLYLYGCGQNYSEKIRIGE